MNNQNGSSFSNGFLFGLIIGGAAVFLLGTKRGKKILKSVSEEGLESLSDFIEEASTSIGQEEEEETQEETPVKTKEREVEYPASSGNGHHATTKKRFFRRTPKS